jgi:hypothetical protein
VVTDWLEKLGMSKYAQRFADNDIDFSILGDLTDQDLKDLGVASLGHRRKILRAIAELEHGGNTLILIGQIHTNEAETWIRITLSLRRPCSVQLTVETIRAARVLERPPCRPPKERSLDASGRGRPAGALPSTECVQ